MDEGSGGDGADEQHSHQSAIVPTSARAPDRLEALRLLIEQALGSDADSATRVKEVLLEFARQHRASMQQAQPPAPSSPTAVNGLPLPQLPPPTQAPWVRGLLSMLHVPQHLTGAPEVQGLTAAVSLTMAIASASAGAGGVVPQQLLSMVSPFRSHIEELAPLGKGGFGRVVLARNRLDNKLMAIKQVPFRSPLPPWSAPELLEERHSRLLREVRALANLDFSPHVVRYHHAWLEPQWEKIGQVLQQQQAAQRHACQQQGQQGAGAGPGSARKGPSDGRHGGAGDAGGQQARGQQAGSGPQAERQCVAEGMAKAMGLPVHMVGITEGCLLPPILEVVGPQDPTTGSGLGSRTASGAYGEARPFGEQVRPHGRVLVQDWSGSGSGRGQEGTSQSGPCDGDSSLREARRSRRAGGVMAAGARRRGQEGWERVSTGESSGSSDGGGSASSIGRTEGKEGGRSSRGSSGSSSPGGTMSRTRSVASVTRNSAFTFGDGEDDSHHGNGGSTGLAGRAMAWGDSGAAAPAAWPLRRVATAVMITEVHSSDSDSGSSGSSGPDSPSSDASGSSRSGSVSPDGGGGGSAASGSSDDSGEGASINEGCHSRIGRSRNGNSTVSSRSPFSTDRSGWEGRSASSPALHRLAAAAASATAAAAAAAAAAAKNPNRALVLVPSPQPQRSRSAQLLPSQPEQEQGHVGDGVANGSSRGGSRSRVAASARRHRLARAILPALAKPTGGTAGGMRWPYMLYIAMEAVPGVTLDVWLQNRARGFLPAPPAAVALSNGGSDNDGGASPPAAVQGMGATEKDIFRQLLLGLLHCHSAGIIHRDLKPSNIFIISLDQQGHQPRCSMNSGYAVPDMPRVHVKIGDFGLAAQEMLQPGTEDSGRGSVSSAGSFSSSSGSGSGAGAAGAGSSAAVGGGEAHGQQQASPRSTSSSATRLHTSGVGTASYSAPEQLKGNGNYGPAVDMFPLGLILMELCCPFATGMERAMAMRDARRGRLPPSMAHGMPGEAELARCLLSPNPRARPTVWEALQSLERLWYAQPAEAMEGRRSGCGAGPSGREAALGRQHTVAVEEVMVSEPVSEDAHVCGTCPASEAAEVPLCSAGSELLAAGDVLHDESTPVAAAAAMVLVELPDTSESEATGSSFGRRTSSSVTAGREGHGSSAAVCPGSSEGGAAGGRAGCRAACSGLCGLNGDRAGSEVHEGMRHGAACMLGGKGRHAKHAHRLHLHQQHLGNSRPAAPGGGGTSSGTGSTALYHGVRYDAAALADMLVERDARIEALQLRAQALQEQLQRQELQQ